MKKCTIIPAIAAVCFLAGCDWGSWCGKCSKNAESTESVAKTTETPTTEEQTDAAKTAPVEAAPEAEQNTAPEAK